MYSSTQMSQPSLGCTETVKTSSTQQILGDHRSIPGLHSRPPNASPMQQQCLDATALQELDLQFLPKALLPLAIPG